LVFEGGGVKGIGFGGALQALADDGYEIKNVAGTSAGAITAALVAAGYTAKELDGLLREMPFKDFCDEGKIDRLPGASSSASSQSSACTRAPSSKTGSPSG